MRPDLFERSKSHQETLQISAVLLFSHPAICWDIPRNNRNATTGSEMGILFPPFVSFSIIQHESRCLARFLQLSLLPKFSFDVKMIAGGGNAYQFYIALTEVVLAVFCILNYGNIFSNLKCHFIQWRNILVILPSCRLS